MDLSKSYDVFQPEKYDCRVHIIGCGSVGSTIAENLARYGVTKMTLWDFDVVEAKNIANQMFRVKDINRPKVDALADILAEVNPDITDDLRLMGEGWKGQQLSGFVFLCVDSIEIRQQIVDMHMCNPNIRAMFDIRTGLWDAQHYAADWSDYDMRQNLRNSMNFSHEEAKEETPVSACNVTLGVCTTVRLICALAVKNFVDFWNGNPIRKFMLMDSSQFTLDAF